MTTNILRTELFKTLSSLRLTLRVLVDGEGHQFCVVRGILAGNHLVERSIIKRLPVSPRI